jgi:hypothetical protein
MSTWPNRGGLRRPLRGAEREKIQNPNTVRPRRSDSSQQASSKPGAVQSADIDPCGVGEYLVLSLAYCHGLLHHR